MILETMNTEGVKISMTGSNFVESIINKNSYELLVHFVIYDYF